VTLGMVDNVPS